MSMLVVALTVGAVLGVLATGLVLIYRTTNVFNFGHGAIAMIASYAFYVGRDEGQPTAVAFLLAMVISLGAGGLIATIITVRLRKAPLSTQVALTLALLIGLQGVAALIWGPEQRFATGVFGTEAYGLPGGATISRDALAGLVGSLLLAGLTIGLLRWTRLGLFLRARVESPLGAEIVGISLRLTGVISWMVGACLAAFAGILVTPLFQLDPFIHTLLLIQAYAAALVGRLSNIGLTIAGGFAFGLITAFLTSYVQDVPSQLKEGLPFLLIFVLLFFQPRETPLDVARKRVEVA